MASTFQLARVDEETWGEKLGRLQRRSPLKQSEVAQRIRDALDLAVNPSTLSRLQNEPVLPKSVNRRILAAAYVIVLGYDPEDFGITPETIPPVFDLNRMKQLLSDPAMADRLSRWIVRTARHPHREKAVA